MTRRIRDHEIREVIDAARTLVDHHLQPTSHGGTISARMITLAAVIESRITVVDRIDHQRRSRAARKRKAKR